MDALFLAHLRVLEEAGELGAFVRAFMDRTRRVESGCLNWIYIAPRYRQERGRGAVIFDVDGRRRSIVAHRAAWLLFVGRIEPRSLVVRHLCHNRFCVNWRHLEPGNSSENRLDNRHKPAFAPRLRPMPSLASLPGGES